jgi:ABC-type Mn2+/Zn2+ transport system permease subunit
MDKKLGFYFTKSFAIFLMSIYFFIFGSIMSIIVNKLMRNVTDEKELKSETTSKLILDILFTFGIIGLGFYFIRIYVKNIPYIFEGAFGYRHSQLKEATGGVIIGFIIFIYQGKLIKKINELQRRFYLL